MSVAKHRARAFSSSRLSSKLRRLAVLAALTASIGCDSTSPSPGVTGVWEARFDFLPSQDSLFLVLTQDGSTVRGYGFVSTPSSITGAYWVYDSFDVGGTVTGNKMDLSLGLKVAYGPPSRLSGFSTGNQLAGVFDNIGGGGYGGYGRHAVSLRRARPASVDVAGTWALSSTTGGSPGATADTIILAKDGRGWERREGLPMVGSSFTMPAMWRRSGDWLVIHHFYPYGTIQRVDSLRVTPSELQRPPNFLGGVEHFTRISTAAAIP
jgi:hypothetical protein